jgi:hypothetical protein
VVKVPVVLRKQLNGGGPSINRSLPVAPLRVSWQSKAFLVPLCTCVRVCRVLGGTSGSAGASVRTARDKFLASGEQFVTVKAAARSFPAIRNSVPGEFIVSLANGAGGFKCNFKFKLPLPPVCAL